MEACERETKGLKVKDQIKRGDGDKAGRIIQGVCPDTERVVYGEKERERERHVKGLSSPGNTHDKTVRTQISTLSQPKKGSDWVFFDVFLKLQS